MTVQRVLLHNHSTWSDGRFSLAAIARLGEFMGASAVVMSEHDYDFTPGKWDDYVVACEKASNQRCIIIPGIEYSSPDDDFHIVTVGAPSFHGARRDLTESIAAVRAEGGVAVLAHPGRRACLQKLTLEILDLLDGVEIWNRKSDGLLPSKSYYEFARSRGLAVIVGMDLHTRRQIFPMWNEIDAGPECPNGMSIAAALRERKIAPSCFLGGLAANLDRGFSLEIGALAAAERVRLLLRDMRDMFARSRITANGPR